MLIHTQTSINSFEVSKFLANIWFPWQPSVAVISWRSRQEKCFLKTRQDCKLSRHSQNLTWFPRESVNRSLRLKSMFTEQPCLHVKQETLIFLQVIWRRHEGNELRLILIKSRSNEIFLKRKPFVMTETAGSSLSWWRERDTKVLLISRLSWSSSSPLLSFCANMLLLAVRLLR